ncbi:hypothetical protein WMY93_023973 [Mugilogobius chulae]|uniref:Uncharacterized protein n=1 Tax=Mugilogobius chulae TaxID=88201 RepID=A0AAW0NA69_9GOBI
MADPYHQNNYYHQGRGDAYGTYGEGGGHDGYGYQADFQLRRRTLPVMSPKGTMRRTRCTRESTRASHIQMKPKQHKELQDVWNKVPWRASAASELQELSEQYEDIMEDCGHGKFQWTLFMVLGLALMADGVECFVVAFVLPSAEKDCVYPMQIKGC